MRTFSCVILVAVNSFGSHQKLFPVDRKDCFCNNVIFSVLENFSVFYIFKSLNLQFYFHKYFFKLHLLLSENKG